MTVEQRTVITLNEQEDKIFNDFITLLNEIIEEVYDDASKIILDTSFETFQYSYEDLNDIRDILQQLA